MAQGARPLPRRVTYAAIGQFVVTALAGIGLLLAIASGTLPLGEYDRRIIEHGDVAGYIFLWFAWLWISVCLLAAGLGTRRLRSGRLRVRRRVWVWLVLVSVPCVLIGAVREAPAWQDLRASPAVAQGLVTAASSEQVQTTDSRGSPYSYTIYHLTVAGLAFTSSNADDSGLYTAVPRGHCAVITYGRHTHTLTALTPCAMR